VTGYKLGSGIQIVIEAKDFLYCIIFQSSSRADPVSFSMGNRVKQPGSDVDHSSICDAEGKSEWR
jgi:hypothetical protein